ncbi:MAG: hypothetical protein PVH41_15725 [Anaerolineae bacterium]|jgi:epoxyqueuosine reductase
MDREQTLASPTAKIVAEAELYPGIKAGIARLDEVLDAPSYHVVPEGSFTSSVSDEQADVEWPPDARSVLVLGLHHPEGEPSLDWWDAGVSPGDRRLMDIADLLKVWLESEMGIGSFPLP